MNNSTNFDNLKNQLIDINLIKIDTNLPPKERLQDYINAIKNPCCYLDGETIIKLTFSQTDLSFEDCLNNYLNGL